VKGFGSGPLDAFPSSGFAFSPDENTPKGMRFTPMQ
jgi:hypothetical protein